MNGSDETIAGIGMRPRIGTPADRPARRRGPLAPWSAQAWVARWRAGPARARLPASPPAGAPPSPAPARDAVTGAWRRRVACGLAILVAHAAMQPGTVAGRPPAVPAQPAGATDFTPHGTQPGLFYPLDPAARCQSCHGVGGSAPPTAPTFLPYSTWSGSMMANATRDPVFFAALDVANHDAPGSGDFCLRCHSTVGWYNGHVVKAGFGQPDNDVGLGTAGCLLEGRYDVPDSHNDYGGVTCHFCHRLKETGPNGEPPYGGSGVAWIDDEDCSVSNPASGGGPCRAGPYDYAFGELAPPHAWRQSEFHTRSELCGTCHDVSSPELAGGPFRTLKLADGTDTGRPFPIERTFSEWRQSAYAQAPQTTCQDCHMPTGEDPDAMACILDDYPNRSGNLPVHAFVGGNTWVPQIIKGEYGEGLGGNRRAALDRTSDWARRNLAMAATLETTLLGYTPPAAVAGTLDVAVKVTNRTGHKLPTGYGEGRRMWLNVQVRDAQGALVFESAAYDPDRGVLERDPQARIYEVEQGIHDHGGTGSCDIHDADGNPMFHFVLNDCVAGDNRIPPLGFRPASAQDPDGHDIRPVPADRYPETAPGSGILVHYDVATYHVAIPVGTPAPLTATARLYFQASSRDYIEFLRREAQQNAIPGENDLCAGAPGRPFPVGPQELSRGEYLYGVWSGPTAFERVFGDGFDAKPLRSGYGKSPPELVAVDQAGTALAPIAAARETGRGPSAVSGGPVDGPTRGQPH